MLNQENRLAVLSQVVQSLDYSLSIPYFKTPMQGQFVISGAVQGGGSAERRIGYCVQIRKKCGAYGSDMVLLRHANGKLTVHENQCFFAMTEDQEKQARSVFEVLPEEEDYSPGYSCYNKVHEVGFIVEDSRSTTNVGRRDTATAVITTTHADGRKEVTAYLD